jgi:SAM-dependent methyltransferase
MNWNDLDWPALERLRAAFLAAPPGAADYWKNESDLASYDATFAQRIGWKWDYLLRELERRGWSPPPGDWLDWGCGSGIAARACLDFFGPDKAARLWYWDRSPLARQFALAKARQKYPALAVATGVPERPAVALLSHVLGELQPAQAEALADKLAATAQAILWVEPGTYQASLGLIAIRERLRDRLHIAAPCTHQGRCGILQPGNEPHWCHHFASPPPAVFTDPDWGKFARLAGIDLRSLPLSFLVLDTRPVAHPENARRILGRPRLYKGYANLLSSGATGVHEHRLQKRHFPETFRQIKKNELDPLQLLEFQGRDIVSLRPFLPK